MFALNYLGVQKQNSNLDDIYLLLIPEANWVIKMGDRFLKKNGRFVSVDVHCLVSAAEGYWCSELFSVGMCVLNNLDALYKFSVNKVISEFCQLRSLMLIYEVAKFLYESRCFCHGHGNLKTLEKFVRFPIDCFYHYVVPLDGKKSLTKDMISLRATAAYQDLVKEVICENIRKDRLTYGQIGRAAVMILGTPNPKKELFVEIVTRFEDNLLWQEFIQSLHWNSTEETSQGNEAHKELHRMFKFYEALQYTYNVNWIMEVDYISPSCFMYLIERLLLLTSYWKGFIFATKSSFVEWLIYQDGNSLQNLSLLADVPPIVEDVHQFIAKVLRELLNDPDGTIEWIRKSNINVKDYFPLFVLRLVVSICVLHLISGKHLALLRGLLGKNWSHMTTQLPLEFYNVLWKGRNHLGLKVFAEAFKVIDDPLVIVGLKNNSAKIVCPDAIVVDSMICQQRELIVNVLFPNRVDSVGEDTAADQALNSRIKNEINESMNVFNLWDVLEKLKLAVDESCLSRVSHYSIILKEFVDPCIELLISSVCGSLPQNPVNLENKNEMGELLSLLDEMKQLSSTLSVSDTIMKNQIPVIGELCKKILSRQPNIAHVLNQLLLLCKKYTNVDYEPSQASTAIGHDDHLQNDLEESKDNMSRNSQADINSGPGNTRGGLVGLLKSGANVRPHIFHRWMHFI